LTSVEGGVQLTTSKKKRGADHRILQEAERNVRKWLPVIQSGKGNVPREKQDAVFRCVKEKKRLAQRIRKGVRKKGPGSTRGRHRMIKGDRGREPLSKDEALAED